jgi:hypothetical protein
MFTIGPESMRPHESVQCPRSVSVPKPFTRGVTRGDGQPVSGKRGWTVCEITVTAGGMQAAVVNGLASIGRLEFLRRLCGIEHSWIRA